jgi:hypothetical protein
MRYSLKNLMCGVVSIGLTIILVAKVMESQRTIATYNFLTKIEPEERAKLEAFHAELDRCLGKGWRFERDSSGTLVVQRLNE